MDELVTHMLEVAESGDRVSDQPSWRALCGVVRDAAWRIKGEVDRQRSSVVSEPSTKSSASTEVQ